MSKWEPSSWRTKKARQLPDYPDLTVLGRVEKSLSRYTPLVLFDEIEALKARLAEVAEGRAFLLQGGDCAESFAAFSENAIQETLKVLSQMALVLTFAAKSPVVKVARIAGQFAKPRSMEVEVRGGETLPIYRGDIINGIDFTPAARTPDPERMVRAAEQMQRTLKIMRESPSVRPTDLTRGVHLKRFHELADKADEALRFLKAIGGDWEQSKGDHFTSHEALLLPFEQALTRKNPNSGAWYDSSAHLLWLGYRTGDLDGAHVEFLSGIANPIGIKIGPETQAENVLRLIERLNPENIPGKLTLVCRYGAEYIDRRLPGLIQSVAAAGRSVIWSCDPMHGNTVRTAAGLKTRPFERILGEVRDFFDIHRAEGTHAGGIHLELTGQDVTECTGGAIALTEENLHSRYHTHCDPRLNADQSLELAFLIAEGLVAERIRVQENRTA